MWTKEGKVKNLKEGELELEILVAQDYRVHQFSEYHFRINERLDVWPSTRKFYDLNTQKHGLYYSIKRLIKEQFPHI